MKKFLTATAAMGAAVLSLATTGCFKAESKNTVNADGSAKFNTVMEFNLAPIMSMLGAGGAGANPMGDNHNFLVTVMRSMAPQVDAWTEAKVETTKLGATKITLGGFMKDFTAGADLKKSLSANPEFAAKAADLPDFKFIESTKDTATGNWVITMPGVDEIMEVFGALQKKAAKDKAFTPGSLNEVTEEAIAAKMTEVRAQYAQFKPMAAMMLKDMSITSEMEVGGEILEAHVFEKSGPGKVTATFNGEQLIELVDGIIADDELPGKVAKLAAALNEGPESAKVGPALREFITPLISSVYGGSKAPKLVIKPAASPAFNYSAEVAKAKANMSPELMKLVDEASKPPVPADAGGLPAPKKKAA
ncbi:MAG: hypothetical protein EOP86_12135 [Verrucomicrobiaceae bacterium]|nr:MAG: hypothetical protein EOP86_12135 [Verrucomicrobiaceae bacterium]